MTTSTSEAYLARLAEQTFLRPWAIANPFHEKVEEISDLLVPFGDDLVIFSDKASVYQTGVPAGRAWLRWENRAIDASTPQLQGALRKLKKPETQVFLDNRSQSPLPYALPPVERRRFHLVAIARPDHDPTQTPAAWPGLTYRDKPNAPFEIGPREIDGHFVHVFDGESIDLLLAELDTGPDFISYLASRARLLSSRPDLVFRERDLLAAAVDNWRRLEGFVVEGEGVPPVDPQDGDWARYMTSEARAHTMAENRRSYSIDNLIELFHDQSMMPDADGLFTTLATHEEAMRMLALESRFSRRVITAALYDLFEEKDQSTFWTVTVPSRDQAGTRYVWLTYPPFKDDPPPPLLWARWLDQHLAEQILMVADTFTDTTTVGFAVPSPTANDDLYIVKIRVSEDLSDEELEVATRLREAGVTDKLDPWDIKHVP